MSRVVMRDGYHHGHLRTALVAAAVDQLARGVEPSLRDVARRAGVAASAVYHHFADKEALLAAVAQEGFEALAARQRAIVDDDPTERLVALGQAYVQLALERPAHFGVMFGVNPSAHPDLAAAADQTLAHLRAAVLDARPGEDPAARALHLWSYCHGVAELTRLGPLTDKLGGGWPALVAEGVRRLMG